jgi:hypothetical protein
MDKTHRYQIRKLMNIEKEEYKVDIRSIYNGLDIIDFFKNLNSTVS